MQRTELIHAADTVLETMRADEERAQARLRELESCRKRSEWITAQFTELAVFLHETREGRWQRKFEGDSDTDIILEVTDDTTLGRIEFGASILERESLNRRMSQHDHVTPRYDPLCKVRYSVAQLGTNPKKRDIPESEEDFVHTFNSEHSISDESVSKDKIAIDMLEAKALDTLDFLWTAASNPDLNPDIASPAQAFLADCQIAKNAGF